MACPLLMRSRMRPVTCSPSDVASLTFYETAGPPKVTLAAGVFRRGEGVASRGHDERRVQRAQRFYTGTHEGSEQA